MIRVAGATVEKDVVFEVSGCSEVDVEEIKGVI